MKAVVPLTLIAVICTSCSSEPPRQQSGLLSVRRFVGAGVSESERYKGTKVNASATVVEMKDHYECLFVFYSDTAVPLQVRVKKDPNNTERKYVGTVDDPRGFVVEWTAKVTNDAMTGTYKNPRDHGRFDLRLAKQW